MQMKMEKTYKFPKNRLRHFLEKEDEFVSTLFDCFEVPDTIEENEDDEYLLETEMPKEIPKFTKNPLEQKPRAKSAEELKQRLEIMQNKMKSKKAKPSERALKKKQAKKLKKEMNKKVSAAKSLKNEKMKSGKVQIEPKQNGFDKEDIKPEVKHEVNDVKKFNEEGKLLFPKFEFAARPSQAKKSKNEKTIKNPKLLLDKIKKEKNQISELMEQGETEKAEELKQNIAWKKAFDKTEGKKVKDNATLLHKAIHKRKVEKKKAKHDWKERQQKVEKNIEQRQKKRQDNIEKKISQKKKNKLKQATKRGRVIAGY